MSDSRPFASRGRVAELPRDEAVRDLVEDDRDHERDQPDGDLVDDVLFMLRVRPASARQAEAELPRFAFAQALEEMLAAQGDVAVVAADLGLRAGRDGVAVLVDAQVHRRLAAAFANCLELDQRVRERQERGGTGEELGLEIGAEAVAEHRDAEPVGDLAKLDHVPLGEELRLVDEDAVELAFFSSSPMAMNRSTVSS